MAISRRDFLRLAVYGFGATFLAACRDAAGQTASPLSLTPKSGLSPTVIAQALTELGFEAFADRVKFYQDEQYLYVESNGMPDHPLMVGIQSWQQQVPLPHPYIGTNAWKIPLHPVLSDHPISARTALYRGAIALAVNGVPIFNALNNRGDDALLFGELDEFGGHAGRADDYHYHIAPLHLEAIVGKGKPIAYALDGFPIYGSTEPDGSPMQSLDEFNGHFDAAGNYHYHGTTTYPYLNGGLRGVVQVRDDQIEPQPRTTPIRPFLQPLRGARITDFKTLGGNAYSLAYQLNGQTHYVNYRFNDRVYTFDFIDAAGVTRTETYQRR